MGVTSPPVVPQILHTYAGPWVMHRLHSDRQAWPLSSPGWGLPVAPGGFSWNPHLCAVPAGFSVRQDVYLGVWGSCLRLPMPLLLECVLDFQGPAGSGARGHSLAPHRGGHAAITTHMAVSPTFCHLRGPSFLGFEEGSLPQALVAMPPPLLLPHSHNQPAGLCGERTGLSLDGVPEVARLLHPGWTRAQAGWGGQEAPAFLPSRKPPPPCGGACWPRGGGLRPGSSDTSHEGSLRFLGIGGAGRALWLLSRENSAQTGSPTLAGGARSSAMHQAWEAPRHHPTPFPSTPPPRVPSVFRSELSVHAV